MKVLSILCAVAAVFVSDVMCFIVGYNYADMKWGIVYAGYSAPAKVAFLTGIPCLLGVVVLVVLSVVFWKRSKAK